MLRHYYPLFRQLNICKLAQNTIKYIYINYDEYFKMITSHQFSDRNEKIIHLVFIF